MPLSSQIGNRLGAISFRDDEQDKFYLGTYPAIRQYFLEHVCCLEPQVNDVKIAVMLAYTWMGRAKLQPSSLEHYRDAVPIIERARTSAGILSSDIQTLGRLVGDSLIATSKFLHFLNPEKYAIWDTKVAWAAYHLRYDEISKLTDARHVDRYLDYLRDLSSFQLPANVQQKVTALIPNASELRKKEFALFHLGIAELKAKKAEKRKSTPLNIANA